MGNFRDTQAPNNQASCQHASIVFERAHKERLNTALGPVCRRAVFFHFPFGCTFIIFNPLPVLCLPIHPRLQFAHATASKSILFPHPVLSRPHRLAIAAAGVFAWSETFPTISSLAYRIEARADAIPRTSFEYGGVAHCV